MNDYIKSNIKAHNSQLRGQQQEGYSLKSHILAIFQGVWHHYEYKTDKNITKVKIENSITFKMLFKC